MIRQMRIAYLLLTRRERQKLVIAVFLQLSLSILELIGILLFSVLINLIVTQNLYIKNQFVGGFLDSIRINSLTLEKQAAYIAIMILIFFLIRSLGSAFFVNKLNKFLARRSADIVCDLINYVVKANRRLIEEYSKQSLQVILIRGTNALLTRTLGGGVAIFSDIILLVSLLMGMFIFEPSLTVLATVLFGSIFIVSNKMTRSYLKKRSVEEMGTEIQAKEKLYEILFHFKDFAVNSNLDNVIKHVRQPYLDSSIAAHKISFVSIFNRYFYEAMLLLCVFLFSAIAFLSTETRVALTIIATFTLATSRIVPAILRIQQQVNVIQSSTSYAQEIVKLISVREIKSVSDHLSLPDPITHSAPILELFEVEMLLNGSQILKRMSMSITRGEKVVLIGESGSGKTTLLDVMAGIQEPSHGRVKSFGLSLRESISSGLIRIGYVPQSVGIIKGSIRDNILFYRDSISESDLVKALDTSSLNALISGLPFGIDTIVGDGGKVLSGGEKQRIGLARALAGNPDILFLDEFTSNLDTETEQQIVENLIDKSPQLTIVSVAHRPTAIQKFSRVIELVDGFLSS